MDNNKQNLLFDKILLPDRLLESTIKKISEEKYLLAKRRTLFSGFSLITSFICFWETAKYLSVEISSSGFINYFSFLFSDTGAIGLFWRELIFSLAETFPVVGIGILCIFAFVSIASIKSLAFNFFELKINII